jgi:hypothetical protein
MAIWLENYIYLQVGYWLWWLAAVDGEVFWWLRKCWKAWTGGVG